MLRIGSDTGGTFTDLVDGSGRIVKVPSTPDDPGQAVRDGIAQLLDGDALEQLCHGTTVATNALLERKGANVALVTNEGFVDIIEIARQDRPSLYDQTIDRPQPLVPREWRYGVRGRLADDGSELEPVDVESIPELDPAVDAVAVCLLHSDLNPTHEQAVAAVLRERGNDVTASHELSPEFREYERTVTTTVNAYLRPKCRDYVRGLADAATSVMVMTSAGGLTVAEDAAEQPARLLLSGPAGGVAAAAAVAKQCGFPDAITFDMGGTSTDVCLVLDGQPEPAAEREVAGFPVRLPSLDVVTIGAGGGSIARIDAGGALAVGPQSAGAVPGPACYGRGGAEPTVTDANLVLGRIPDGQPFPGLGVLDRDASARALANAGVDANGVIAVVNAHMEQALRKVSVERGVDPRGLALVAFGGAGPLHACALAESLGMRAVIIPPRAGVLSAVGILCGTVQVDLVQSWHDDADDPMPGGELLRKQAIDDLAALFDIGSHDSLLQAAVSVDCRYRGQSHELRVEVGARWHDSFHALHERRNGYRLDLPIEIVALRATARFGPIQPLDGLPPVERSAASGPVVVGEPDCTIWVPEGWVADPHRETGSLVLRPAIDRPRAPVGRVR